MSWGPDGKELMPMLDVAIVVVDVVAIIGCVGGVTRGHHLMLRGAIDGKPAVN